MSNQRIADIALGVSLGSLLMALLLLLLAA